MSTPHSPSRATPSTQDLENQHYEKALHLTLEAGMISTAFLQKELQISYSMAARVVDRMQHANLISSGGGSNPRQVYRDKIKQEINRRKNKHVVNIYLDIDGVLVTKDHQPARHAHEFISYILQHHPGDTYWLSTRCQGDAGKTVAGIANLFNPETVELLHQIQPTIWLDSPLKTSAIDFSQQFLWFDDHPLGADKQALHERGVLGNWIEVNLEKNPSQLLDFVHDFPAPIR